MSPDFMVWGPKFGVGVGLGQLPVLLFPIDPFAGTRAISLRLVRRCPSPAPLLVCAAPFLGLPEGGTSLP